MCMGYPPKRLLNVPVLRGAQQCCYPTKSFNESSYRKRNQTYNYCSSIHVILFVVNDVNSQFCGLVGGTTIKAVMVL